MIGLRGHLASLVNPELEAGAKKFWQSLTKCCPCGANCYNVVVWLPGLVAAGVGGQSFIA